MVLNWMGVSVVVLDIVWQVVGCGYVVLVVDFYGRDVCLQNGDEVGVVMMLLKNDWVLLCKCMYVVLVVLCGQVFVVVDMICQVVFGFCFGGCCVLELVCDGVELKVFVFFYGILDMLDLVYVRNIKGVVLVFDGVFDLLVLCEQLLVFVREMIDVGVDWQFISYGGVVYFFIDLNVKLLGKMYYDVRIFWCVFQVMDDLLVEVFV